MKVLFTSDVPPIASKGERKNVSDGFARNYLFRRGLAIPVTKGIVRDLEEKEKQKREKEKRQEKEAHILRERIDGKEISIISSATLDGNLYGSVREEDIKSEISNKFKVKAEMLSVHLDEPIKQVGVYTIEVSLYKDVKAKLRVKVKSE